MVKKTKNAADIAEQNVEQMAGDGAVAIEEDDDFDGFIIDEVLTNRRSPAIEVSELVVTPSEGGMRISEIAAKMIGITDKHRLVVVSGAIPDLTKLDIETYPEAYELFAEKKEDLSAEDFKEYVIENSVKVFMIAKSDGDAGQKLAYNSENKVGSLGFSSGLVWKSMGGDPMKATHYYVMGGKPGEEVLVREKKGFKYYPCLFVEQVDKTPRKKSEKKAEE